MTADELAKAEQHFEYTEGEAWAYGPRLIAEVRRLRGLIDAAHWVEDACPWCQAPAPPRSRPYRHRPDCPAFGAD